MKPLRNFAAFVLIGVVFGCPPANFSQAVGPPEAGEVDRLLTQLKAKNEIVIARCHNKECKFINGKPIDGRTIKGKVVEGKFEKDEFGQMKGLPRPSYPPAALAVRASGEVLVQVLIDEAGKIMAAQAISGHPLLRYASVKAAREIRLTPTMIDTKPVKVLMSITYNFLPAKRPAESRISREAVLRVEPIYPAAELGNTSLIGEVTVRIIVDRHGQVISAQAISGDARLHKAAVEAARRWKFKVAATGQLPIAHGAILFTFAP